VVEGRFVSKERFINAFFQSRKNLMRVKEQISRSSDNQYLSEGLSKYDF
jgi:hypothetical protein